MVFIKDTGNAADQWKLILRYGIPGLLPEMSRYSGKGIAKFLIKWLNFQV